MVKFKDLKPGVVIEYTHQLSSGAYGYGTKFEVIGVGYCTVLLRYLLCPNYPDLVGSITRTSDYSWLYEEHNWSIIENASKSELSYGSKLQCTCPSLFLNNPSKDCPYHNRTLKV